MQSMSVANGLGLVSCFIFFVERKAQPQALSESVQQLVVLRVFS